MRDLLDLTALEAHTAAAAGEISQQEYNDAWREAAAADNLNVYLWRDEGGQEASAIAVERDCIAPVAVKDIFCTEGVPTTAGSRILEGYRPPYTATAVRHLIEAGAPILGKTNMDEFAMGSSNENSAYGPVLNPWDRGRVPGGSSGGSAAVVAGRLAPWAIGTDTGGSIRQPASLCGIVGLKPTYGSVSRYGMIAFASSLDQCGPLTRDVADAALLLAILQGRDPLDSTSVGIEGGVALPDREDLTGLRFGVPAELASDAIEAGVREVFDLARYDGVRYGMRSESDGDLIEMYEATRAEGFGPEVKRRIMLGTYALSSGYYEAYYGQAQKVRTRITQDFDAAFAAVDFVVTPTSPSVAFGLGEKTDDPLEMYMNDFFTVPMSLAGIPAISIPAGLAEPDGGGPQLPVGFQIAAPAFGEQLLLDAAHALEGGIGFDARPGDGDG